MRFVKLKRRLKRAAGFITVLALAFSNLMPAYGGEVYAGAAALSGSRGPEVLSIGLAGDYADGTYEGTGTGFAGSIAVEIKIDGNSIREINVTSQNETPSRWSEALAVIDEILGANSTDVDSVSGATKSSEGIKEAVNDALSKALITDTQVFDGGNGSKNDPYRIAGGEQLRRFSDKVNSGSDYKGKHIELSSDVSLNGRWTPIGASKDAAFAGSFSGAGHEINGLEISGESTQYAGLFGYLGDGAGVSGIKLTDVSISATTQAAVYAGAIAGYTGKGVVIDNCRIDGIVSSHAEGSNKSYTGGAVGFLGQESLVANCYADADVSAESEGGMAYAGGIAGCSSNKCAVVNTASSGDVSSYTGGLSYSVAGGVFGMHAGIAYNVYALGVSSAAGGEPSKCLAGGISGQFTNNSAALNAYYNSENTNAYMTVAGANKYVTGNIEAMSPENIKSQAFAETMNSGLKRSAIAVGAAKITEAENSSMGNLQDAVNSLGSLYAWEFDGTVALTEEPYIDDTIDAGIFEQGEGTEENPYIIKTDAQFRAFAGSLSEDVSYAGIYVALDGDIDVSGRQWVPIGLGHYAFRGIFDGKGHSVKGMFIGSEGNFYEEPASDSEDKSKVTTYYGLFGVIGENGVVKNLSIEEATVSVKNGASIYAGLLAGLTDKGYVDGCRASGYVYSETASQKANTWAGGLIGQTVRGGVINSWTDAEVYSTAIGGLSEAGAFIGMTNRSVIANCFALGNTGGKASRDNGNEGMPAVSSFIGVHAGKMANCYAAGNMKADSFSSYVGSIAGWSTGIARQFISYYNSGAVQDSNGTINNPVISVGFMVSAGVNDEGEPYDGTYHVDIEAKSPEELRSEAFAALLNANHRVFPLDIVNGESSNKGDQNAAGLPGFMKLREWKVVDGIVMPTGEQTAITYKDMTPEFEPDSLDVADGTYYGRAYGPSGKYIYVKIKVEGRRIAEIDVTEHSEGEGFESIASEVIEEVVTSQKYDRADTDGEAAGALKGAIAKAARKAAIRDLTGYGKADPSIFAGGDGTRGNPFMINTAGQLKSFAESVNEDEHYEGLFVKLGKNISLTGMNWLPVGGSGVYGFRGTFDGNNKVISNMTVGSAEEPEEYCKSVGFFANLEAAKIKNLGIENAAVYHKYMGDSIAYAGLLTGYAAENAGGGGYIDFCYARGIINSYSAKQNDSGGIAGAVNRGTVANCYADVKINSQSRDGYSYAGGISGLPNRAAIVNNYAWGSIRGAGNGARMQIGGIAGSHAAVAVNNYSNVNLESQNTTVDMGGFTGRVTGIAYVESAYYNTEAGQISGAVSVSPAKGVGTVVQGNNYGKGTVKALEGKTLTELKSAAFAGLLNENRSSAELIGRANAVLAELDTSIPSDITLREWAYSSRDRGVVFKDRVTKSSGGGASKDDDNSHNDKPKEENEDNGKNSAPENIPGNSSQEEAAAGLFIDIKGHWAENIIEEAAARKIFSGLSANEFAPDNTMTRAMFVTVLGRLAGAEGIETVKFKDVEGGSWYSGYVGWALEAGIVNGINSEEFGVSMDITREQMAVMLYNFAKAQGLKIPEGKTTGFTDENSISIWAKSAVAAMVEEGIIKGRNDGSFDPQGKATRAEAAAMIVRFAEKYGL